MDSSREKKSASKKPIFIEFRLSLGRLSGQKGASKKMATIFFSDPWESQA